MKKYLALLLVIVMSLSFFAGCSSSNSSADSKETAEAEEPAAEAEEPAAEAEEPAAEAEEPADEAEEPAAGATAVSIPGADESHIVTEPVTLTLASQGSGTSDYVTQATFASLFERSLPEGSKITQETISSGNSTVGYLIQAGLCDFGGGQNTISATVGLDDREPFTGVSALMSTNSSVFSCQILTDSFIKKTGYSSMEEIVENKCPAHVVAEEVGSSDYVVLDLVLKALGTSVDEMKEWGCTFNFAGGEACSDMLQDGQADIMVAHTTPTSASITELCLSADVSVFSFSDEVLDFLIDSGFQDQVIPAGTYSGEFTEDTRSACQGNCEEVSSEMDFDLAYTLTKIICENKDYLGEQLGTSWQTATFEDFVQTDAMVIPWHPGAMQYFIDIGVIDEDGNYIGEPAI